MIEPVRLAFTTSIRPSWSAKNAMISSAMLPKVALRIPPTCGPVIAPIRSVAWPMSQASPRIEIAARPKTRVGGRLVTATDRTIVVIASPTTTRNAIRATGDRPPMIGRPAAGRGGSSVMVGES